MALSTGVIKVEKYSGPALLALEKLSALKSWWWEGENPEI